LKIQEVAYFFRGKTTDIYMLRYSAENPLMVYIYFICTALTDMVK